MAKFCFVEGCRYNHTHTTSGHLCGTCKNYGHGKIECKNNIYSYYYCNKKKRNYIDTLSIAIPLLLSLRKSVKRTILFS